MNRFTSLLLWMLPPAVLVALGVTAYLTYDRWQHWLPASETGSAHAAEEDSHAGHAHGPDDSIVLSTQARHNLGLEYGTVAVDEYWQKLPMPGEVVEIPGRSDIALTSQVAGVIEQVFAFPGQAVRPGDPLFTIRITGDDVILAQSAMVNANQQIKVNQAEIDRITPLVPNSVPQATLLKLRYDQQKLEVQRDLHKQELLAHGLSEEQVAAVAAGKTILKELTVRAPEPIGKPQSEASAAELETIYSVASVVGYRGRSVQNGDLLGTLADHSNLLVRGHAFEKESQAVEQALVNKWPVLVEFIVGQAEPMTLGSVEILFTDNVIVSGSRTLEFMLPLTNEIVAKREDANGSEYITWRYKPGQQARLFVPVKHWENVIVLPTEAVTEEGPDAYAFTLSGKKLQRKPVHVLYRDAHKVLVEDDGSLFLGEQVALNNAYQLNLALKKQQGGGGDPHAGHMH